MSHLLTQTVAETGGQCQHFYHQDNFFNDIQIDCDEYSEVKFQSTYINNTSSFSILHINARSLNKTFTELLILLETLDYKFDVIAVSETWFNFNTNTDYFQIENYQLLHTERTCKRGGGVAVYIKSCHLPNKIDTLSPCYDNICEVITVEIQFYQQKILISCIYRAPDTNVEDFISKLNPLLEHNRHNKWFIMGDFNIDLLKPDTHHAEQLLDSIYSYGFRPLISIPTRKTANSSTLIDNIYTNEIDHSIKSGTIFSDISDHLPIFAFTDYKVTKRTQPETLYIRKMHDSSKLNFLYELQHINWEALYTNDVESSYDNFFELFLSLVNKHFPFEKIHKNSRSHKPWMTKALIKSCLKKNQLYKLYLSTKSEINLHQYKQFKNKLTHLINIRKKEYFRNLLNRNKNDLKGTWRVLNQVIHNHRNSNTPHKLIMNEKHITNKIDIANLFNDYFANIGLKLHSDVEPPNTHTLKHNKPNISVVFSLELRPIWRPIL